MSSARFDPCRQWLGIDAVELGDPRRVLGILPSETDPLVVLRAAEARLTLLRGIAPGPFDMARNALIKRVEESREAVLAQIAAAPKPPVAVGTTFTMPPPPGGAVRPAGMTVPPIPAAGRMAQPPQVPMAPPVPSQPVAPGPWAEQAGQAADDGFVSVKTRPVYRKHSGNAGAILLLLALLAAAAGGLAWYVKNGKRFKQDLTLTRGAMTNKAVGDQVATKPARQPAPQPEPEPELEPRPRRKLAVESDLATRDPDAEVAPEDSPTEEPVVVPEPSPDPDQPDTPDQPDQPEAPEAATAESADANAIVPLLEKALAELQKQDFDGANDALGQAGDGAMSKPATERLARWQALVTYANGFADYRRQALDALRPGVDLEIGDTKVAIVDIDDEKIVYRLAGKNKTTPRSRIPATLLLAIVTGWFDQNPANHLYLGAFHATKPEPDLDKAREAWELADRKGADASELLPLLADPVLVKAAEDALKRDDQVDRDDQ